MSTEDKGQLLEREQSENFRLISINNKHECTDGSKA
jgi:hypothetical protein